MRRLIAWLFSAEVRKSYRRRRLERKLRGFGISRAQAVRIASQKWK